MSSSSVLFLLLLVAAALEKGAGDEIINQHVDLSVPSPAMVPVFFSGLPGTRRLGTLAAP
jgi:hypothetical protein